tara:strand:+ start:4657 stop:4779 length:123 start_codon:yes stop_codon:yes gene_type:complete
MFLPKFSSYTDDTPAGIKTPEISPKPPLPAASFRYFQSDL